MRACWLQLASPLNLASGERLRLLVEGSARRIAVRLLPRGASPDSPTGLIGAYDVPEDGVVMVALPRAAAHTVQVSVHGLQRPFGLLEFPRDNGPATLISADRCTQPASRRRTP